MIVKPPDADGDPWKEAQYWKQQAETRKNCANCDNSWQGGFRQDKQGTELTYQCEIHGTLLFKKFSDLKPCENWEMRER
jgi:hypothetical protein